MSGLKYLLLLFFIINQFCTNPDSNGERLVKLLGFGVGGAAVGIYACIYAVENGGVQLFKGEKIITSQKIKMIAGGAIGFVSLVFSGLGIWDALRA